MSFGTQKKKFADDNQLHQIHPVNKFIYGKNLLLVSNTLAYRKVKYEKIYTLEFREHEKKNKKISRLSQGSKNTFGLQAL